MKMKRINWGEMNPEVFYDLVNEGWKINDTNSTKNLREGKNLI